MADENCTFDRATYQALAAVQHELNVPKSQVNKFGGYKYRSLEDINGAAKPLCESHDCGYAITDNAVEIGGRVYIMATVRFWSNKADGYIESSALAREEDSKKGMDEAQITGLASSYARKYALCGLFAIDGGEEVDVMDNRSQNRRKQPSKAKSKQQSKQQQVEDHRLDELRGLFREANGIGIHVQGMMDGIQAKFGCSPDALTDEQLPQAVEYIRGLISDKKELIGAGAYADTDYEF